MGKPGRPTRYQIMELHRKEIVAALQEQNEDVLSYSEIESTFMAHKQEWKLPKSTTLRQFLEFLVDEKEILIPFEFGPESRRSKKFYYKKKDVNPYKFALSLMNGSYLSHFSAVTFHDLTDEIIKSIYVNKEQSAPLSEPKDELIPQEKIDQAFQKKPRFTTNYVDIKNYRIYILRSQYTGDVGVVTRQGMRVTNLERTLIDITVRPHYAGGVHEVLEIYKKAKGEASINRLNSYLKKMNFRYPYHQAIGFYLEKAGYKENAIKLLERYPRNQDFYLGHNMYEPSYDEKWRIYYPGML